MFQGRTVKLRGVYIYFCSFCGFRSGCWKLFSKKFPEDKTLHFQDSLFYSPKFDDTTATVMLFFVELCTNTRNPLGKQTNLFTGGFPGDLSDAWKKGWSSKEPWKGFFFLSQRLELGTFFSRMFLGHKKMWTITGWWQLKYVLIFNPIYGEDSQVDSYFSMGLKPPTRLFVVSF